MLTAAATSPAESETRRTREDRRRRLESLGALVRRQQGMLEEQAGLLHALWLESGFPASPETRALRSPLAPSSAAVTNGAPAEGRFPETCAVLAAGKDAATGVILHERLALTALHVAAGYELQVAYPVDNVRELDPSNPRLRRHVVVADVIESGHDGLALLELTAPQGPQVSAPRLAGPDDFKTAFRDGGTMVGFGVEVYGSTLHVNEKRVSRMPVLPTLEPLPDVDPDTRFVVPENLHRACTGDSGGPFYAGSEDDRVLVGIASQAYGSPVCERQSVYIRIDAFADQIREAAARLGIELA